MDDSWTEPIHDGMESIGPLEIHWLNMIKSVYGVWRASFTQT